MAAEEELRVDIVADDKQFIDALTNVSKEIRKFSTRVNTGLEGVEDSLNNVADAMKGIGTSAAQGARQGTQELKKLDQQAKKSANISSKTTSPSAPLSSRGGEGSQVAQVQAAMAGSTREARELSQELQRQEESRKRIAALTNTESKQVRTLSQLTRGNTKQAAEKVKQQQRAGKLQAEEIKQLAIARTLRLGTNKVMANGTTRFVADISRVTPAIQQAVSALPRLRYALFDAARGFAVISAASAALAIAPAALAVSYRREFADVERTTGLAGAELERLRQDFIRLKQDIPISWKEITDIGTLAGQLGISGNLIADFSASVARFSATTDLNVEQSATLFGRLNQLIDGVDGQFEKLSSSINKVGVISVATESQIGQVAQNIAAIANQSGLAASEVVGLAGALASLGVRPELARGTVTRLFSNINRSVSESGRNLQEYGRLTNQTAEEFGQAWQTDASTALLEFFRGIDEEGTNAEKALRDLGITSVRDVPTILRLAQNYELVAELVREAGVAFDEGNESQRQYSAITSTVAEQLKLLGQNLGLLTATVGEGANALSGLVGVANDVVKGLIAINNNPIASTFFLLGGGVLLTIAAFAGLIAIFALTAAKAGGIITSLVDLRTVMIGTTATTGGLTAGLKGYVAATTKAIVGTQRLRKALIGLRAFFVLGLAIAAISAGIGIYTRATEDSIDASRRAFGEISSFTEAVKADTEAHLNGADAIIVRNLTQERAAEAAKRSERAVSDSAEATRDDAEAADDATGALRNFAKSQEDAEEAAAGLTKELQDQIVAFDEVSIQAAIDLGLTEGTDVNKLLQRLFDFEERTGVLDNAGVLFRDIIIAAGRGTGDELAEQILQEFQANKERLQSELSELTSLPDRGPLDFERIFQIRNELTEQQTAINDLLRVLTPLNEAYEDLFDAGAQTAELEDFARKTEDVGEAASLTSEDIDKLIDRIFGAENAARQTQNSITDLGEQFGELGEEALGSSEAMQGAISSILNEFAESDPKQAVFELIALFQALAATGIEVTSPALQFLRDVIEDLGPTADVSTEKINRLLGSLSAVPGVDTDYGALIAEGFDRIGKSAGGAAEKVKTFDEQMNELLDTLFETINAERAADEAIFRLGERFAEVGDRAFFASSEMQKAIRTIVASSSDGEQAVANLSALFVRLQGTAGVSGLALNVLRQTIQQLGESAGLSAQRIQELINTAGGGLATVALNNFKRGVQSVAKEVRTLLDFASDLRSVISRAFDIRFSTILQIDRIADSWKNLSDRVNDARESIDELKASQQDLSADRSIKEYFLSVADAYGDTLRAAKLRKEIAELDRQQAQNARELRQQQLIAGGDLTGGEPASRQSRRDLLGLVQEYQDYIVVLAESGASQSELRRETKKAREEFIRQATELGFQRKVVLEYAQAFDDVQTAIGRVERNITVDANTDPAIQALNELNAKLQESIEFSERLNSSLGSGGGDGGGGGRSRTRDRTPAPSTPSPGTQIRLPSTPDRGVRAPISAPNIPGPPQLRSNSVNINTGRTTVGGGSGSSAGEVEVKLTPRPNVFSDRLFGLFSEGGFTGRGGKFDPAGIVHKGEFVVPKQFVNQSTGLPDPSFLAQLQNGLRGFANGGFVGGGGSTVNVPDTMMVELSPFDRELLQQAGNVQLRLDGRVVAQAANRSNVAAAQRGSN